MNENKISIGTVQFAINAENNPHIMFEHPLGSLSRLISELISYRLNYLGIESGLAKLIITKPEEKTTKQLIYTSMLPLETAKKILETRYFDYCLYGEINFSENLNVEISLLDSNEDKNLWRRSINLKNYDFSALIKLIIQEVIKILKLDKDITKLNFLDEYSTKSISAWGWYAIGHEDDLGIDDKILALNKALDDSPNFIEARLKLISYELASKVPTEIFKTLEDLKNLESDLTIEMFVYFANTLFNQEKYSEALHFYQAILNREQLPDKSDILLKITECSFKIKNTNIFNLYLEKYLNEIEHNKIDFEKISFFLINLGDSKKALELAIQGLKIYPESAKIYSTIAFIKMQENSYHEAIVAYQKSFSFGFNANILEDWSSALLKISDFESAKNIIEKYKDDLAFNSGLECNLAIVYLNLDSYDKAVKILEYTVKVDKENAKANALLGNIYFRQKSYARAQKYFSLALKKEPDNANWHKSLGDLFYDNNDTSEANKYYTQALKLDPEIKIARYLCSQGDTLKKENKLQEAFNKYKTASKIENNLLKPLLEMGDLCILTDDYDKAIEFFEEAVKKFPDDIQALQHLYQVYFSKSKGLFKKSWKIKAEDIFKKIESIKNKNLVNTNDKNIK